MARSLLNCSMHRAHVTDPYKEDPPSERQPTYRSRPPNKSCLECALECIERHAGTTFLDLQISCGLALGVGPCRVCTVCLRPTLCCTCCCRSNVSMWQDPVGLRQGFLLQQVVEARC